MTSTFRYERVYQRNGVGIFPIPKEGYIRLIRTSAPDGRNRRIAPMSGIIEDADPSPLSCAKREMKEELGLAGTHWKLLATVKGGGGFIKNQHFFTVRGLTKAGEGGWDPNERIHGFLDLSFEEVRKLVFKDKFPADISFALLKLILKS